MPALADDDFVAASAGAGVAVRHLHSSGAILDRTWTVHDELRQLAKLAGSATRPMINRVIARCHLDADELVVPAHRDYYPAQVVQRDGTARLIDLDDMAMAPPALDVANFIAHLDKDGVLGTRSPAVIAAARTAFLAGYGDPPDTLSSWRELSLARLVALAETRHRDPDATHLLNRLLSHP